MTHLRRLNELGIERFRRFLLTRGVALRESDPQDFIEDPELSSEVAESIDIEKRVLGNRFQAAEYLFNKVGRIEGIDRDRGVWTWLAWMYFDQLASHDREGRYRLGSDARWVADVSNFQRYYRHLLAGPYLIYKAHADNPERARILLCQSLDKPGDIVEQMVSRQEVVTNKALVGAATALYLDPVAGVPKRGAGGKGPGSARRLATLVVQLDLTWDLYGMEAADFVALLPAEFDRFRVTADIGSR